MNLEFHLARADPMPHFCAWCGKCERLGDDRPDVLDHDTEVWRVRKDQAGNATHPSTDIDDH